ncbi:ADP-ribosylglycohydrolase family protein [Natronincola ferrireducens]|uniref:ADP-ribosylglycohydrolase n=1 Tax=Natronincola ferrireducens TaxID=393762 RepID=A0A1G9EYS5_9FIRM|nr:ADP-ribosylglycohydrolase family protein [Natronincola ferrireducens]SDK81319.1 ADP-ribosylglycohydrolase [Natronincola ferrireducens]
MLDRIAGVLYGMAIGDAMGMPPELWSRKKTIEVFGEIRDFLDGHKMNSISCNYKAGQFTDDTAQALVLLDSLESTNFEPNYQDVSHKLLEWAEQEDAFKLNILGPTSKEALRLIKNGESSQNISDVALSNGAAMRIAPIGCLFTPEQSKLLCKYVYELSKSTHSSDITIASACIIAMAIASAVTYGDPEKMVHDALLVEEYSLSLGAETCSPSIGSRIKLGIEYAHQFKHDEKSFMTKVYEVIGASVLASESVPAAVSIAYYAKDVKKASTMCANLGGDTDTIGAMASAICGGLTGAKAIPAEYIEVIEQANTADLRHYIHLLNARRGQV